MGELTNNQLLEIGIAIASSIVLGWIIKKMIFPLLFRLTRKTKWKSDDLVVESVAQWVIFWFFLGACLYVLPIFSGTFTFVARNETTFHHVIGALYIFSLTWVTARIVAGMLEIRSKKDGREFASTSILGNIARAIIYCIGLILILQTFGVAIAPLLTALGVGGIAVALALQPTLSNLFSGLQLIASGKINIGDLVQLESGQRGIIRDITWRNTTIETGQNNIVVVPNSKMADSIIENYYLFDREILFNIVVGVGYESDLEKVERVSVEVAKSILAQHDGGVKGFVPFVLFFNFGESRIDLRVYLKVNEFANQALITSDFIKALHKRYALEAITIPFPARNVFVQQK